MFGKFDLLDIFLKLPAILLALSFHEFAHALVSDRLGDPTPRIYGRITLDPTKHIDPIGFMLLLFVGFGWAKPVPISTHLYKNRKRGQFLVSVAGPLSNFILAFLFSLVLNLILWINIEQYINVVASQYLTWILFYLIQFNLILFVFNLIPVPPLDGSKILASLLPDSMEEWFWKYERIGRLLLLFIVISPLSTMILRPLVSHLYYFVRTATGTWWL